MRYRCVAQEGLTVKWMCRLLAVSRSGYYAWSKRNKSSRSRENEELTMEIRHVYEEGQGSYGSPTIVHTLKERGLNVNHKRIERLMRQMGLRSKLARRFKRTTRPCRDREAQPNLVRQHFSSEGPNRLWLSDITYIHTQEGWLYLTMIEDVWCRMVVGHAMTDHLRADGVLTALQMALGRRRVEPGLIFHSDRGKQYIDGNVRKILAQHQIRQSMSSTGNCYDNAMAESFFATLKKGHIYHQHFRTRQEARRSIFEYLEVFYNRVRRHSALGYKSPVAFEESQKLAYLTVHQTG